MKRTIHDDAMRRLEKNKDKGDDNIGKKVGNNIKLVEKIGQGAMGAVYLGYDTTLKRWVACKVLLREMFQDERQFEYLKKLLIEEGRNLARVRHPGIIVVHDVDANYPALIMEYMEGVDFHTFLYDKKRKQLWGRPAFKKWFLQKMMEVADALRYAHANGLIHKDLKPSNIMISKDEDGKWNKMTLIDFGLAQDNRKIKLTDGEIVLGTPSYMAPEQWSDLWEIDRRTDVFSFGIMLYEVLMEDDYHGEGVEIPQIQANIKNSGFLQSKVGHLPIDQRTIFELCLAYEPAQRAGGMLESIGLLRSLQLALTHREKEYPGTSFPKLQKEEKVSAPIPQVPKPEADVAAEADEKDVEEVLQASLPEQKPVRFDQTIAGHPGPNGSVIPGLAPEPEPEPAAEVEPEPAIVSTGESVDISMSEFDRPVKDSKGPAVFDFGADEEAENRFFSRFSTWIVLLLLTVVAILVPLAYQAFTKEHKSISEDPGPSLTYKAPKPKVMKPAPVMKVSMKPKPMRPAPMKPLKPVITKITPPKPLIPKAPAEGQLPSLKYTVHLYKQVVEWCQKNDKTIKKHSTDKHKSNLWLTWCLRKRVQKLYHRDRENPEIAIVLLDEVRANRCFWEMLFIGNGKNRRKDAAHAKECKRIFSFIVKNWLYWTKGDKLHRINDYVAARKTRRVKIRSAWKKAHPSPK
jgi:serine/threonine protein kinase